ncbi:MAG TPA: Ig-like domain-containing protein, partial [Thermoplasmata archaeon]|nr:Ig-like domain-containing protein [Thermoplasmata archaeon]
CNGQDLGQVGDQNTCTSEEYGDPWDTMGNAGGRMHYDTYHKRKIGWIDASKTFIATTKRGIFDIEPVENMAKDLGEVQVPWEGSIYLTLEFRQPIGYDAGKTGNLYKGITMHLAPWSRSGGGGGSDSHLVDVNPSGTTKTDSTLEPGRTWTAPSKGIEITVISVSAASAKVRLGPASNDTSPPDVAITSPKDGDALPSTSVTVTGTSSDNVAVQQVDVQVNTGAWVAATGTTSWSAQVTVPAGTSTICARAIDTSGNFKTTATCPKVTVDASPPKVAIDSPKDGDQASTGDITVAGTASDDTKVDKVELSVNSGGWTLATGTDAWSGTVTLSEGGNSICAKATDGAAKTTTSKCINVGFDKTPPTVAIVDPKDGAVVNLKDYIVKGTASDNQGVVGVEVQLGGGGWVPANGTNSWTAPVTLAEGKNQLCAQAKDKAGLMAATTPCPTVTLDTTPPAIVFTAPSPGLTVPAEALAVSGTASDNIKVERVELKVGGGGWFKVTGTDSWSTVVNLPAVGPVQLCARGVDSGGNIGDGTTCVEVTSLAPRALKEVRIEPGSAELEPGGTIKFSAQALDAEGQELPADALMWKWQVTEGSGKVDSDGLFTAPRTVGKNRVVVTATFRGESKSAVAEVSVKSSVDVGGLMGQLMLPLILAVIAVIALVAGAMAVRSRKRKKASESGDYWANRG